MNTSIKRKRRAGLFLDRHAAIYYLMTMFKYHGFIFLKRRRQVDTILAYI